MFGGVGGLGTDIVAMLGIQDVNFSKALNDANKIGRASCRERVLFEV